MVGYVFTVIRILVNAKLNMFQFVLEIGELSNGFS